jgi:hypothetical protein
MPSPANRLFHNFSMVGKPESSAFSCLLPCQLPDGEKPERCLWKIPVASAGKLVAANSRCPASKIAQLAYPEADCDERLLTQHGGSTIFSRTDVQFPLSRPKNRVQPPFLRAFRQPLALLVLYEKLGRSFLALNHLAASIIAFRKIKLQENIIYGKVPSVARRFLLISANRSNSSCVK